MGAQNIISINIWQIVISLANLVILYLILKRFLFKPVQKVLKDRQSAIDDRYAKADEAVRDAENSKAAWQVKMDHADEEARALVKRAADNAERSSDAVLQEAQQRAHSIVNQAQEEARLERRKAEEGIRGEIAGLSTELASRLLGREVNDADHRGLIDDFINELGEQDEQHQ
ncbi:MAG: F0F1 ATP synthase subunit B [Clostridia bacterium]|nr:F0F1 ATP synthase subunit B [Clostridia bacterium]